MVVGSLKIINKFIGRNMTVIVVKSHVFRCKTLDFSDNFVKVSDEKNVVNINHTAISYVDFFKEEGVYKIAYKSSEMVSGVLVDIDKTFIQVEITNFHTENKYDVLIPLKGIEGIKVFNEGGEK